MNSVLFSVRIIYKTARPFVPGRKEKDMEQLTIQIDSMKDVEREIDRAQRKACTSIVEIGYILRKADDAQLYKEKGYTSIFTFAKETYGWDQSRTSRFMAINREYSEGGYSAVLKTEYEGFGEAKLSEMLLLPESIREEIGPDMKRDDIRRIKNEYKQAEEEKEIETFSEAFAPAQMEPGESRFAKCVKGLFSKEQYAIRIPHLWKYMKMYKEGNPVNGQDILMAVKENGYGYERVGSCMCFFRKDELSVVSGNRKEKHSYTELLHTLLDITGQAELDEPENWYRNVFRRPFPGKETDSTTKSTANNGSPLVKNDSGKVRKPSSNDEKTQSKTKEKCGPSTAGTQTSGSGNRKTEEAAVKTAANDESPLVSQPLPGQSEIKDFTTKMPIKYEKPSKDDQRPSGIDSNSTNGAAAKTAANDESPLVSHHLEAVRGKGDGGYRNYTIYAVDFDGTLCGDIFQSIGSPNMALINHLIKRRKQGNKIILWTCRAGEGLQEAVEWCRGYGLEFDTVNANLPEMIEQYGNDCRKVAADVYIDDKAVNKLKYHVPYKEVAE